MTEPNLRFPAVSCENLRFPAKICGFLRPPNAVISRRKGESAKICGFLRKSAFWVLCHLSSVPLKAPGFMVVFFAAFPLFEARLATSRTALKGLTYDQGRTPICDFLRFSESFCRKIEGFCCENLQSSARTNALQM